MKLKIEFEIDESGVNSSVGDALDYLYEIKNATVTSNMIGHLIDILEDGERE